MTNNGTDALHLATHRVGTVLNVAAKTRSKRPCSNFLADELYSGRPGQS